ncbi:hypothetical protein ACETK8_13745 [Brevundimonas staleyi]|uniref:HTH luxR-type domain-containing protein n=1 Tax=Brevundimonas staleyi TaxID=74326 RepID=A0ABW0FPU6_9CAUL
MIAMTDPNPDYALTTLNASERELLLLLGRGHTAKSIAALKGLTELAVNERFRSARRKTGIGSSREIARLLVAKENRDDIIGVAEPAAPVAPLPRPDAPHRASPLRRWSLSMSAAAILIAAAVLAQQTATPPERPLPSGAEAMFAARQPSPDLVALRASISAEPADPAWSPEAETALSQAYHRVTDGLGVMTTLDVTCTRSLCEVLGVSRSGLTGEQINAVTGAVQNHEIEEVMGATELENIVQSFSTNGGEMENGAASVVFAAYWRRTY